MYSRSSYMYLCSYIKDVWCGECHVSSHICTNTSICRYTPPRICKTRCWFWMIPGKYGALSRSEGHSKWFLQKTLLEHDKTMDHPWMQMIYKQVFSLKQYATWVAMNHAIFKSMEEMLGLSKLSVFCFLWAIHWSFRLGEIDIHAPLVR